MAPWSRSIKLTSSTNLQTHLQTQKPPAPAPNTSDRHRLCLFAPPIGPFWRLPPSARPGAPGTWPAATPRRPSPARWPEGLPAPAAAPGAAGRPRPRSRCSRGRRASAGPRSRRFSLGGLLVFLFLLFFYLFSRPKMKETGEVSLWGRHQTNLMLDPSKKRLGDAPEQI